MPLQFFYIVSPAVARRLQQDAASKAEEMLLAMNRLNQQGMPNLKPDAFTYTAVIDVSIGSACTRCVSQNISRGKILLCVIFCAG